MNLRSFVCFTALVCAVFAVGSPSTARAEDDATTLAARQRFREGVDFFDKGQFDNARAAFLQAYALKKHPDLLLNLGHSSLKLSKALEARRYFRQFLSEAKTGADEKRSDAEAGIREAEAKLAKVTFLAPDSTTVTIDGELLGKIPITDPFDLEPGNHPIVLDPGTHKFALKAPDGNTHETTSVLAAGTATTVEMPPVNAVIPPIIVPPPDVKPYVPPPSKQPRNSPSIFAPPKNLAPLFIGLGITAVGFAGAGTMLHFRNSTETDAKAVEDEIARAAALEGRTSTNGLCNSTDPATVKKYGEACRVLKDDYDKVDTNALVGNIFLGVGIAGGVGTIIYYFAASKRTSEPKTESTKARRMPVLRPMLGDRKGVELSISF